MSSVDVEATVSSAFDISKIDSLLQELSKRKRSDVDGLLGLIDTYATTAGQLKQLKERMTKELDGRVHAIQSELKRLQKSLRKSVNIVALSTSFRLSLKKSAFLAHSMV